MTTAPVTYFTADGDHLTPTPHARSSWSEEQLHGRLVAGLLGRAASAHLGDDFVLARLTVDLARSTPLAPVVVTSRVVRDGRRARTVDLELCSGPTSTARAFALLLRRGEDPPGEVWSTRAWDAPPPESLPPYQPERGIHPPWEVRDIDGTGLRGTGRKRVWLRDARPLVLGERTSPLVRLAMVADAVSPLSSTGTKGLRHVNADLSLYLVREPEDEWFGFEVTTRFAADGVAAGACTLHDRGGPFGMVSTTALGTRAWRGGAGRPAPRATN